MSWLADGIIVNAARGILEDAEKDGKVQALAEATDKFITEFFPRDPKGVKQRIVQHVLFPLAKLLMKDDPDGYAKAKTRL